MENESQRQRINRTECGRPRSVPRYHQMSTIRHLPTSTLPLYSEVVVYHRPCFILLSLILLPSGNLTCVLEIVDIHSIRSVHILRTAVSRVFTCSFSFSPVYLRDFFFWSFPDFAFLSVCNVEQMGKYWDWNVSRSSDQDQIKIRSRNVGVCDE